MSVRRRSLAQARRRKAPKSRLAGYKADFRKTSKGGIFYESGVPPHFSRYFKFSRDGKKVELREGWTDTAVLRNIGGRPFHRYDRRLREQRKKSRAVENELQLVNRQMEREGFFDPENLRHDRRKVLRAIAQRQGQSKFRK